LTNDVQANDIRKKEDLTNDIEPYTTINTNMKDSLKKLVEIQDLQACESRVLAMKGAAKKKIENFGQHILFFLRISTT
jgi:hypothetical protein